MLSDPFPLSTKTLIYLSLSSYTQPYCCEMTHVVTHGFHGWYCFVKRIWGRWAGKGTKSRRKIPALQSAVLLSAVYSLLACACIVCVLIVFLFLTGQMRFAHSIQDCARLCYCIGLLVRRLSFRFVRARGSATNMRAVP